MSSADVTAQARIRDAAVALFAEQGFERPTVRGIAGRAGVSPALVIHHFGSKEALRRACDDWVMRIIADEKDLVAGGGSLPELQSHLRDHPVLRPVLDYLVACLRHGGDIAASIFDRMCALTAELLEESARSGVMRRPNDPAAAVAILVAYSCGAALLGDHLARHLGGPTLLDPKVYARYGAASLDLFTYPLMTDDRYLRGATHPLEES